MLGMKKAYETISVLSRKNALLIVIAVELASISTVPAQQASHDPKPPKQVVEDFLRMEVEGGRFSPDNWSQTDLYFSQAGPRQDLKIFVVGKRYVVWDPVVKGNTTEINVEVQPEGRIDSALRFTPIPHTRLKNSVVYKMVLTEKPGPDRKHGKSSSEPESSRKWLIEGSGNNLMLDTDAAIRYVTLERDKARSLVSKKDADLTISALKKIKQLKGTTN